jgi:FlaA1/EpsC-like NDP-sugar epimerase
MRPGKQDQDPLSLSNRTASWLELKRRFLRCFLAMITDAVIVFVVYYLVLNFRHTGEMGEWQLWSSNFSLFASVGVVTHVALNWLSGVYNMVNRYVSLSQAVRIAQAGTAAAALLMILVIMWPLFTIDPNYLIPRSVVLLGAVCTIGAMISLRFSKRLLDESPQRRRREADRLLLIGAGQAADMLIRETERNASFNARVVGLLDDSSELKGMTIQGVPVLGDLASVVSVVERHRVNQIVVAIPSASAEQVTRIYRLCKPAGVPIKIHPSLAELVSGVVSFGDARDLEIQDLLGRPKIETDLLAITDYIRGRTVLVTGAGGSIGSELCLQLAHFEPRELVLLDHDESALYDLHERLQTTGFSRYVICPTNILQKRKLERLFVRYAPKLVFHAAAYKHVPLMELSPDEAVINNIEGTLAVAETAAQHAVERFVYISTDKAVAPVNVMGATKRAGELIIKMLASGYPDTRFAVVRFGNVLGSQGSVIPVFKGQIEGGGPVVITHPEMTRFFMLIEEAVQLVLQAAIMLDDEGMAEAFNQDTFILDMGEPVSIVDLAHKMIEFYWKDQSKSIGVEFSGLRPGEKMGESLIWPDEFPMPTSHSLIKRVSTTAGDGYCNGNLVDFERDLAAVIKLAHDHVDDRKIVRALVQLVPGYKPLSRPQIDKVMSMV